MSAAISASTHEPITVLLLGDGPVVEPLEQALSNAGHDVEVGEAGHASAMFTAVAPELVVLCGRATEHGGAPVLAALSEGARDAELKVVVLGAASSSARARALAPNLPPAELARRLVEIARAPVPAAPKPASKAAVAAKRVDAFKATLPAIGAPRLEVAAPMPAPITAPKPVAAPKPEPVAAPKPAAVAAPKLAPVAAPKPAAVAVAAPKPAPVAVPAPAPAPASAPKARREPTLVGMPIAAAAPAAEVRPATPTLVLEPAAALEPPVTATPRAAAAAPPDDFDDLEIGVEVEPATPKVAEPVAAAPEVADADPSTSAPPLAGRAARRIPKLATAAVLAAAALGLLLLPGLGSHAEGARKLAQVEVRGVIPRRAAVASAPPVVRIAAPTTAPSAAAPAAAAPAPDEAVPNAAAQAAPAEKAAAPEPSVRGTRPRDAGDVAPSLAEAGVRSDAARPLSTAAALAQAKASVRKAEGYMRDGRLGMAEAAYLKSLALFPRYPLAIAGLTRIHLQRHDAGEALRWAKMLVASQPNRGNNQRMLGDAYALAGKQADATRAWQQAVRYGDRTARQRLAE